MRGDDPRGRSSRLGRCPRRPQRAGGAGDVLRDPRPSRPHQAEIRVLACTARRVQAPELVALIDEFDRRFNPWVILFESNAAFQGSKDLFAMQTRFGPKLKSVTQSAPKAARVAAFSVAVENGAFRLRGNNQEPDPTQRELYEEMITFPFGEHDDLLDAAAMGTALPPQSPRTADLVIAWRRRRRLLSGEPGA